MQLAVRARPARRPATANPAAAAAAAEGRRAREDQAALRCAGGGQGHDAVDAYGGRVAGGLLLGARPGGRCRGVGVYAARLLAPAWQRALPLVGEERDLAIVRLQLRLKHLDLPTPEPRDRPQLLNRARRLESARPAARCRRGSGGAGTTARRGTAAGGTRLQRRLRAGSEEGRWTEEEGPEEVAAQPDSLTELLRRADERVDQHEHLFTALCLCTSSPPSLSLSRAGKSTSQISPILAARSGIDSAGWWPDWRPALGLRSEMERMKSSSSSSIPASSSASCSNVPAAARSTSHLLTRCAPQQARFTPLRARR